jgi:predicted RND superfamily exporter protein
VNKIKEEELKNKLELLVQDLVEILELINDSEQERKVLPDECTKETIIRADQTESKELPQRSLNRISKFKEERQVGWFVKESTPEMKEIMNKVIKKVVKLEEKRIII